MPYGLYYLDDEENFYQGRCLGSKSGYSNAHPSHRVVFNANVLTPSQGKIWHGDLDLTLDGDVLQKLANKLGEAVYILYEMDCRFTTEHNPNWDRAVAIYHPQ
jgi:hypothetical protein